jgi:hypothetical protein
MTFEKALIVVEDAEHLAATRLPVDTRKLATARKTFARLRATPWLARADLVKQSLS